MYIKFSHKYKKLGIGNGGYCIKAKLLDVVNVKIENMSAEFLRYDTDDGLFELPNMGDYMMLIFLKDDVSDRKANIFTTLRRKTEEKEIYYRSKIEQWVDVEYQCK